MTTGGALDPGKAPAERSFLAFEPPDSILGRPVGDLTSGEAGARRLTSLFTDVREMVESRGGEEGCRDASS